MRIAFTIETDGPGGAETVLLNLAEELRRRGHTVVPVVRGWLEEQLRVRGFEPEILGLGRGVDWACVADLFRHLRRRRIDVLHSHEFTMAVYGAAVARLARVTHVITMHGGGHFAERRRRRAALRWAFRRSRVAVGVSRATAMSLERTLAIPCGTVEVIPNGVPIREGDAVAARRRLGLGPADRLILAIGNLYPVKGHAVLLRALAQLEERSPGLPWCAAIAGRGQEETSLHQLAEALGIAERVRLLGFRSDTADLLAAAQIVALPSLSEGLPLVLLEAMGAGRAVVASAVGGIPEVISPGRDGLLVTPGDVPELATALERLLRNSEERARLGQAARRLAIERYSVQAMTDAYEEVYGYRGRDSAERRFVPASPALRIANAGVSVGLRVRLQTT